MADDADSKSVVGNHVRVQVPPPAVCIDIGINPMSFLLQKNITPNNRGDIIFRFLPKASRHLQALHIKQIL